MVRTRLVEKFKHYALDTLIAVGGMDMFNYLFNKVELFSLSSSKWQIKESYIGSLAINYFSILSFERKFIVFGGACYGVHTNAFLSCKTKLLSTIARFDPIKNSWTKLGELKAARSAHRVIQVDKKFIVVGGGGENVPTESCELNGESMICTTREPKLSKFESYPVLLLVP